MLRVQAQQESQLTGSAVTMRDGAEMWEVLDSGNQRLVAVLQGGKWIPQGQP